MTIRLNYLMLVLYCGLIYWLSDQHKLPSPHLFDNEDKLQHFLAYLLMGALAWQAFAHWRLPRIRLFMLSVAFCGLYGWSDEWHQSFVAGRHSGFADWLADFLGGLLAGGIGWYRSQCVRFN
ncbi:MAG: VanZ family protein [Methylococcales bacterium]|nr:VanZ family protein [Methylococcales bacterium]